MLLLLPFSRNTCLTQSELPMVMISCLTCHHTSHSSHRRPTIISQERYDTLYLSNMLTWNSIPWTIYAFSDEINCLQTVHMQSYSSCISIISQCMMQCWVLLFNMVLSPWRNRPSSIKILFFLSKKDALFLQVWVHNVGLGSLVYSVEQICDDSGEDPSCCRYYPSSSSSPYAQTQADGGWTTPHHLLSFWWPWTWWALHDLSLSLTPLSPFRSVSGSSVQDHIYYLGVSMHAEAWSSCRIVMDYSKLRYRMDINGNIVLSKHLGLSGDLEHSDQWFKMEQI